METENNIINQKTKVEKIKIFFIKNKKKVFIFLSLIIISLITYFLYIELNIRKTIKLSNKYNLAITKYKSGDKNITEEMKLIINEKNKTYSPLAFYFLLDNDLISDQKEINNYFDLIIEDINLDKEIKYLNIYKKALYNSNFDSDNKISEILQPILKSNSVWKPHSLLLLGEYFFSKNNKLKSKKYFQEILSLKNVNQKIVLDVQKRLNRDFGE